MGEGTNLNVPPVKGVERHSEGAVVVHLVGELDLYNAPEVRTVLLELASEQPERLVIDLAEVTFVDSTALGVLIEARDDAREPAGVPAGFAGPGDSPRAQDLRSRRAPRRARHGRSRARGHPG